MVTLAQHLAITLLAIASTTTATVFRNKAARRKAVIEYQSGVIKRQNTSLKKLSELDITVTAYKGNAA